MAPASLNTGLLPLLLPLLHFTRAAVVVPRQQVTCDFEITASSGDTCQSFSDDWVLSLEDFESINPGVTCPNLVVGQSYCVLGTVSPGTTTMSSSTLTSSTLVSTSTSSPLVTSNLSSTSSTSSSSAPNQPQQTGTVANCDRFYLVKTGDSCDEIESQFDITASELLAWNPSINLDCTNIQAGFYYCIDVPGATKPATTTTVSETTSTSTNGITTPTPHQTGIASNCDKFYLVVVGDACGTIAANEGISLTDFYAWNPAVGTSCQFLDLDDYVCVGVIGATPTTISTAAITSTIPTNGIPTPTPYQTGMASNCISFHLVGSGDQCGDLSTAHGISLSQFYSWNPAVGSSCQYLDLGDYVCVGIEMYNINLRFYSSGLSLRSITYENLKRKKPGGWR